MVSRCDKCGEWCESVLIDNSRKGALIGAVIGQILPIPFGGTIGKAVGNKIEAVMRENEWKFVCPKCGHRWNLKKYD